MTLLDAAASTAFAALPPAPTGGAANQHQQHRVGGTARELALGATASASDATRLGSIDSAGPLSPSSGGGRSAGGVDLEPRRRPLFSFGAIADVQYADQEDGWNFKRDYRRYYRGALRQLTRAVDVWLRDEKHRFALQLGDVIDGSNKPKGKSEAALGDVKAEIDRLAAALPLGVLNSLGNHELYNFPKQRWAKELDCSNRASAVALRPSTIGAIAAGGATVAVSSENRGEDGGERSAEASPLRADLSPAEATVGGEVPQKEPEEQEEECFYYSFCPDDSYRFIALDSYDLNAIRKEPGRAGVGGTGDGTIEEGEVENGTGEARDVLANNNPNRNKNDGTGMQGLDKRFVQYNGGISSKQLRWLEDQLAEATRAGQRVVGFAHVPIHPAEPSAHTLIWNYEEVLAVMHKFDCVAAFLSGHRHRETYVRDENGIHHISLHAALEAPSDTESFASVDVYPDCLELRGHGMVESRTLTLAPLSTVP